MKPHEETWEIVGCGNPLHGPNWACWKVKNKRGGILLRDVRRDVAERYAAFPEMARALLDGIKRHGEHMNCACWTCGDARAALKKAGVLP